MLTIRQIERTWNAGNHQRLCRQLTAGRPEAALRLERELSAPAAVAALGIIWLDETSQPHVPLYSQLVRAILSTQEADGGWGDCTVTAICLRALMCGSGQGVAIQRGLEYMTRLQQSGGIWPKVPIRRMPAGPFVSAFVLCQLGQHEMFRSAVRFTDAVAWFEQNAQRLDAETSRMWDRARLRCRRPMAMATLWTQMA